MVPETVYLRAMSVPTATRMTTCLLQAAYKPKSLYGKNYCGQKRTVNGVEKRKPGLKYRKKMAAIRSKFLFLTRTLPYFLLQNLDKICSLGFQRL